MKFAIGRDQMIEATKRMTPFINARAPLPVLRAMHIGLTDDGLVLTGTDLDLGASLSLPVEWEGLASEQVVVYHRELLSALKGVAQKNCRIVIETEQEGDAPIPRLRVQGPTLTIRVECHKLEDWPSARYVNPEKVTFLGGEVAQLIEALPRIATASSPDKARPILQGILLEPDEDGIAATATDTYRLATTKVAATGLKEAVLIPAGLPALAVSNRAQLMGLDIGEYGRGQVVFLGSDMVMWGRLIEGQFPKWRSLIPKGDQINLGWEFEAGELISALAPMIASKDAAKFPVRVDFSGERFYSISGGTVRYESALCGQHSAPLTEDLAEIAFNPHYLVEVAKVTGREARVRAGLIDRLKPAIFYAGAYRYLLMPTRM